MFRPVKPLLIAIRWLLIRAWLSAVIVILTDQASAQQHDSAPLPAAQQYLYERGEVILRFVMPAACSLYDLTTILSISNVRYDTVTAYANDSGFRQFLALNIPYEVLPPPSLHPGLIAPLQQRSEDWRNRYPAYEEYLALMESFTVNYPQLCQLTQFGTSINGRKLLVLKISDNPEVREPEPVVFYTSTMHGNEVVGYMLMLRLIDHLLSQYESDQQVKHLVDNIEIWINPLANPDGSYFLSNNSVAGATRFNAHQIDLNRNFPVPGDRFWSAKTREPETLAMMNFMKQLDLVLAANLHAGAELVNYPWDFSKRPHADDVWYWYISRAYADTVHIYSPFDYMSDIDNGITNGYAWYPIIGGRQDYTNYYLHAREVTIELSEDFIPPENNLEQYWNYNRQSLLQYINRTLSGITGVITDSLNGHFVRAEIWIENHDFDSSLVFSSATNGSFYRMINGGNFTLRVCAPGFVTQKKLVRVTEGELIPVDFKLVPVLVHSMYPNPFSDVLKLYVEEPGEDLILEFFDLSGRKIKIITQPVVNPGLQEIVTDWLAPGPYVVRITCGSKITRQVMVRQAR